MIDSVITDLERNRKNLDEEFIEWFQLTVDMAEYVGAEIKAPRIPPCFSKFRSNAPTDDHINGTVVIQQYYKRNIAIPSPDTLLSDMKSREEWTNANDRISHI